MSEIKSPDLSSPQFKADPYPFYARLRQQVPLYRTRIGRFLPVWLVTRYEDVLLVLKDERFGNNLSANVPTPVACVLRANRVLNRILLMLDPPDHTRLRTLVSKAFTPRMVEQLRSQIEKVCNDLLDAGAAKGSRDLVSEFALPLPLTVIANLLGVPPEDRDRFHSLSKHLPGASSGLLELVLVQPHIWRLVRYLRELLAQRRAEPRDDLVTALIEAEEADDKLTEDEVVATIGLILAAGYETTVHLISSGALALIQHPDQRARLQQNPALIEPAIEELLRYTSPLEIGAPRFAREDVHIASVRVRRGEVLFPVLGSANRDESQFQHPNTLDLARQPNRHLAFGMGPHFCLGAALARLEGQIALMTLLRRSPELRLATPPESLRWRRGLAIRGLESLPVVLD